MKRNKSLRLVITVMIVEIIIIGFILGRFKVKLSDIQNKITNEEFSSVSEFDEQIKELNSNVIISIIISTAGIASLSLI